MPKLAQRARYRPSKRELREQHLERVREAATVPPAHRSGTMEARASVTDSLALALRIASRSGVSIERLSETSRLDQTTIRKALNGRPGPRS